MRRLAILGAGLLMLGVIIKFEKDEDGLLVAISPFLAALAIAILSRPPQRIILE
jgi:hypothetical protein